MRYCFGSHTLDVDRRVLLGAGRRIHLEPRTLDLLVHLIRHRDRVVAKEELLDVVWGDRFVSESALTTRIKHIRRAVGDDGRSQRVIRTVHRVGYQFLPEVGEDAGELSPTPSPSPSRSADGAPTTPEAPARPGASGGTGAAAAAGGPDTAGSPSWVSRRGSAIFGRTGDLATLAARVQDHRLVTVTGPAGVGKTVLAAGLLESGTVLGPGDAGDPGDNADPDSSGGASPGWLCELANTREPDAVPNVVLDALGQGQHSDTDPLESLLRTLERRSAVLVLDNCEHLVDAAAALAGALLRRCPGIRVVATSRTPLGVSGESVLVLEPLGVDDAVACFVARAGDAGARIDPRDPAIPELCRRLDGLPLAVELAAARARLLGPGDILGLLADRFRLLRQDRDGDGRHRSLDRAIAWSWDGLTPDDQRLLATLTVFAGSFSLEDVGGVAFADGDGHDTLDVVDALQRLVAGSLLVTRPGPQGRTRFRLLESVRDFAAGRLDRVDDARRRHARHFAALAERLDAACQTEHLDEAMASLAATWDNLRAAVGHASAAGDRETVRRIVRAVGGYADVVQAYEVLDWCEHAGLDEPEADTAGEGDAGGTAGADGTAGTAPDAGGGDAGGTAGADGTAGTAPDAGGGDAGGTAGADGTAPDAGGVVLAEAMAVRARMLAHRGDQDRARALAAAAHARHESHATLLAVVWCAYQDGDLDTVVEAAPRLVELSRSDRGLDRGFAEGFSAIVAAVRQVPELEATTTTPADAERGALGALDCLTAGLRLCTADPERAARLLEAVVESSLRTDHRLLLGVAASTLTQFTLPARPTDEAMRTLGRTLRRYLDRGMWVLISADTVMAAKLLADAGDVETACRLLGARRASGYRVGLSEVLRTLLEDELAGRLGGRFEELVAQGEAWRPPEAAEAALVALDRCLGPNRRSVVAQRAITG